MAELISVIVTTYNREDALNAALRSLARQSDADFVVLRKWYAHARKMTLPQPPANTR